MSLSDLKRHWSRGGEAVAITADLTSAPEAQGVITWTLAPFEAGKSALSFSWQQHTWIFLKPTVLAGSP